MTNKDQDAIAKLYTESFKDFSRRATEFEHSKEVDDALSKHTQKQEESEYKNKIAPNGHFEKMYYRFVKKYGILNIDVINTPLESGKGVNTKIFIYDENDDEKKLVYDKIEEYDHGGLVEDF